MPGSGVPPTALPEGTLTPPTPQPIGPPKRRRRKPLPPSEWSGWSDAELLKLRFCDLDLTITGELESRIVQLQAELDARGLAFKPHFWLSNEWFTPDGVPGIAIPFYLAHPRLAKLELAQMFEVEGGTAAWCLKILRHEAGHAIENAYDLRRRRKRVEIFGSTRVPYPEFYAPRPYSKSFVTHLDAWYAQAHPDEDFAETFAVWLDPESRWRERYDDWPALRKLEYMDELVGRYALTFVWSDGHKTGIFAFPVLRYPGKDAQAQFKLTRVPMMIRVGPGGVVQDVAHGVIDPIRLGEIFRP